jgi:hypothetical protein
MKQWIRILTPVLAVALGAALASARPVTAAAPLPSAPNPVMALPAGVHPDAVIDAAESATVVDITKRITPYLYVGPDGLVHMKDVTAAQLGVSEEFLANYKEAMTYSNQIIARGEMTVAPDMTTTFKDQVPPVKDRGGVQPVPRGPVTSAAPGAQPDWGGWDYGQGAMFYSSYGDWTYYRYNYYPLCNSMAAYIYRPWMSTSLCYFWGYNQSYFSNYCYNPYGTYYYMPYQYACNYTCRSNCGCQPDYKPAYFWVRSYYYTRSCGCYQYNWNWQLTYCRY